MMRGQTGPIESGIGWAVLGIEWVYGGCVGFEWAELFVTLLWAAGGEFLRSISWDY